jgi:OmpA-OmpF porin, OOP family
MIKSALTTTCIAAALLASGCATKKYVQTTTSPIQAKVDQVGEQTSRNGQQIEETRGQVKQVDERAQSGISAAQERASAADQHAAAADRHAGEAMGRADVANKLGEKNAQDLAGLRGAIANLEDYEVAASVAVPFGFNKSELSADAKAELDRVGDGAKGAKKFFISVEGFTDSTGDKSYNEQLSKKRADAVVKYLVTKFEIPIFRIHMIGLGQEKPVDEAKTSAARAKNRRVEVKIYSADKAAAALK